MNHSKQVLEWFYFYLNDLPQKRQKKILKTSNSKVKKSEIQLAFLLCKNLKKNLLLLRFKENLQCLIKINTQSVSYSSAAS